MRKLKVVLAWVIDHMMIQCFQDLLSSFSVCFSMSSSHDALVLIHVDHSPRSFTPGFYLDCPLGRHINGPHGGKRGKLEWFTGSSLTAHCLHPLESWDCSHVTFSVSCSCCSYPVPIRSRMVRVFQGCQSWGSLLGLYPLSSLLQINGPLPKPHQLPTLNVLNSFLSGLWLK